MNKFQVRPAFSTLISSVILEGIDPYIISTYLKHFDRWTKVKDERDVNNNSDFCGCYTTAEKFKLLDEPIMADLKKSIMNQLNEYKNEVLGYKSTKFNIITSWGTKTDVDGFSYSHNHTNSFLSAVYYPEEGSDILFTSYRTRDIEVVPDEYNLWTSNLLKVTPVKNLLLFFPSSAWHNIEKNVTGQSRYSIAMNMLPAGNIGAYDSKITLSAIDVRTT